eukprot:TRINITY_DN1720_c0_g5_i1.p1 TRINITY_DN1720_c0_g5~~TRINITY_DN1720_c0_g5_i1.p1  ORF type:complete len:114 (+),score=7.97 TRINITY_DN1720_c0_g5_i1:724-1065(+)
MTCCTRTTSQARRKSTMLHTMRVTLRTWTSPPRRTCGALMIATLVNVAAEGGLGPAVADLLEDGGRHVVPVLNKVPYPLQEAHLQQVDHASAGSAPASGGFADFLESLLDPRV